MSRGPGGKSSMRIEVRVKPNSKDEGVDQQGESFIVRVRERPMEGKANRAIVKLIARHFGVSQSRVRILGGIRSRNKIIEVDHEAK